MRLEIVRKTRRKVLGVSRLDVYRRRAENLIQKRILRLCPEGATLSRLGLTVFLVSDDEIHRLNREYRGKDKPTDVITFSFVEHGNHMPPPPGELFPVAEIFLSVDTIARQAREKELEFADELSYMFVHGVLHAFGYDHQTEREEREMEQMAYAILQEKYPRKKEFKFR
jgi:probable rRNA maturation factor